MTYEEHVAAGMKLVEEAMRMVAVWWTVEEGEGPLCRRCADDAREGGARLRSGRVPANRYECEYCHETVAA